VVVVVQVTLLPDLALVPMVVQAVAALTEFQAQVVQESLVKVMQAAQELTKAITPMAPVAAVVPEQPDQMEQLITVEQAALVQILQ
jgi:hypothetical protein